MGYPLRMPMAEPVDAHCTQEHAKTLLPKVAGCQVSLTSVWHHRWSCKYPKRFEGDPYGGPCQRSFGGSTGISSREALKFCLLQVWAWHSFLTGEECPHDFDSA